MFQEKNEIIFRLFISFFSTLDHVVCISNESLGKPYSPLDRLLPYKMRMGKTHKLTQRERERERERDREREREKDNQIHCLKVKQLMPTWLYLRFTSFLNNIIIYKWSSFWTSLKKEEFLC